MNYSVIIRGICIGLSGGFFRFISIIILCFFYGFGIIRLAKPVVLYILKLAIKINRRMMEKPDSYSLQRMSLLLPELGVPTNNAFDSCSINQEALDEFDLLCLSGLYADYYRKAFYNANKKQIDIIKNEKNNFIIAMTHTSMMYRLTDLVVYVLGAKKDTSYYVIAASTVENSTFTPLIKLGKKRGIDLTLIGVFENEVDKIKKMIKDMKYNNAVCLILHDNPIDLAKRFRIASRGEGLRYVPVNFSGRKGFYSDAVLKLILSSESPAFAVKSYYWRNGTLNFSIKRLSYELAKTNPSDIVQHLASDTAETLCNYPNYKRWDRQGALYGMES
jgi:hypothetical protein